MPKRVGLAICALLYSVVPLFSQNGTVMPAPQIQLFTSGGVVCAGCKLYAFESGTSTPLNTYSEVTLVTANAHPIVLDSAGRAVVYLSANSYRFRLDSAADVTIWTQDAVTATHAGVSATGVTNTGDLTLQVDTDNNGTNIFTFLDGAGVQRARIEEDGDVQIDKDLTIGDATEADKMVLFDGNAQDYHVGIDDSSDELVIGRGTALGTTPAITVATSGATTYSGAATFSDDLAINGGDATSTATTFNLFNATVTTGNLFGAGTANTIGAATGYTNFRHTVFINDTANANMTVGQTINQTTNTNEIAAYKGSDVAHGFTAIAETDTYGNVARANGASGGLLVRGFSGGTDYGLQLRGLVNAQTTTKSTAATGVVVIDAGTRSGTGVTGLGANENMVVFRSDGTARFIFDADGDSHQDVGTAWTNFDSHDDVAALDSLAYSVSRVGDPLKDAIRTNFGPSLDAMLSRDEIQRMKLVTFNADGHHFVNMSKLAMLHTGAIRQLGASGRATLTRLEALEAENSRLRLALATVHADQQRVQDLEAEMTAVRAVLATVGLMREVDGRVAQAVVH